MYVYKDKYIGVCEYAFNELFHKNVLVRLWGGITSEDVIKQSK